MMANCYVTYVIARFLFSCLQTYVWLTYDEIYDVLNIRLTNTCTAENLLQICEFACSEQVLDQRCI